MSDLIFPQFVGPEFENKILKLTHQEYHARRDCVHSSSLKHVLKSGWAYKHYIMNQNPPTSAMRFGSISHKVLLQGSEFLKKYVTEPKFSGFTKDGVFTTSSNASSVKQAKSEWYASLPEGSEVITQEELDRLKWMLDSILSHKIASKLLSDGTPELQAQWRNEETNLAMIMEADFVSNSVDALIEFKTTSKDSRWQYFRRTVEELSYHLQICHYIEGLMAVTGKSPSFKIWVVTESVPPYETYCYEMNSVYEAGGKLEIYRAYREIKRCIKENAFDQAQQIMEESPPSNWLEEYYLKMDH